MISAKKLVSAFFKFLVLSVRPLVLPTGKLTLGEIIVRFPWGEFTFVDLHTHFIFLYL